MTFSSFSRNQICVLCILFQSLFAQSQTARIEGRILFEQEPMSGVSVYLPMRHKGVISDNHGAFSLSNLDSGTYVLKVSFAGFRSIETKINLVQGQIIEQIFHLEEDALNLSEALITGTRNPVERYNSPVLTHTISSKIFEATQSVSISEGLNFTPGLRLENNCQNCGFTQLRMNGLDGPYSQILINSRPVFSALAGVYGLEMIPANMVDRIEVIRGGGSVLYGGNAIAGTVNIITKDPIQNTFALAINQSFTQMQTPDRTLSLNASRVSPNLSQGISIFGFNRMREPWDANSDGFSEINKLKNTTFGFNAFKKISDQSRISLGGYLIHEFRRGGNQFHLLPHQTDLAEQLQHRNLQLNSSFEHYSKNEKQKFSIYTSGQTVRRNSYYGGVGRVIPEGDSITETDMMALNAYGASQDFSLNAGVQYHHTFSENIMLTAGLEHTLNQVNDAMPGYGRNIDQTVNVTGTYAQVEIIPIQRLTLLIGARYDHARINGSYLLESDAFRNHKTIDVPVPRVSAMYRLRGNLKLRTSFAQGYRGPQAFDEDLHIETVGGAARFIQLDPALRTERSNSGLISLNYDTSIGKKQYNFVAEGFYTRLNNPFILSDQVELPNGVAIITKRNGESAYVYGLNLESNLAFGNKYVFQSGATLQAANYSRMEEIWAPEDPGDHTPPAATKRMLRTPNAYGYYSFVYQPGSKLRIYFSGVITGSMQLAHVIDPNTERTVIKQTPVFFDQNIKVTYTLVNKSSQGKNKRQQWQISGGIQNLFNSYQHDFDTGAQRDAGYIYGPLRPRTVFVGIKLGINS